MSETDVEGVATDARGWPLLHAADPCDGVHPTTGKPCVLGYHKGYHRDMVGTEWLSDE